MRDFAEVTSVKDAKNIPVHVKQQLAQEVLAEVPYQITSFMKTYSIHPKTSKKKSMRV